MAKLNQHDIVTKRVLANKEYAMDFLYNIISSDICARLNLSGLRIEEGDIIDPQGKERHADLLYSIPAKKEGETQARPYTIRLEFPVQAIGPKLRECGSHSFFFSPAGLFSDFKESMGFV